MTVRIVFGIVLMSSAALAQQYTISTFAGGALPIGIQGVSASIGALSAVAVDPARNVFLASSNNVVIRLDAATGLLTVVAGDGRPGYSGDNGSATNAQVNAAGVAVDSSGNLYITGSNCVRRVSNGVITTVAGNAIQGFSGDNGPATSAQLNFQTGSVAVDSAGNLFIADSGNNRVRRVSNGVITTVAGNGTPGFGGDNGTATSAQLKSPTGVAVDSAGNLFIADSGNNRVRRVSSGVITTVAGNGTPGFGGDNGTATSAQLSNPWVVAVDIGGNLYIADQGNYRVRRVSNGIITTAAGNGSIGFSGDGGPATSAQIAAQVGVAVDSGGSLYIADYTRARRVSSGVINTIAGNGTVSFSGDNGPAISAQLSRPSGVALDSAGNLYFADEGNDRIRKVSNGVITTVAGNGTLGFGGDNGPATSAQLFSLQAVAVDSGGNLYIADTVNSRIRKVSNGVITTVAGNGTIGFSGDNGPATSAQLNSPEGLAVDSVGNLYIWDVNNFRVRKVSNGVITTVAGNGTQGFGGDDGSATSAQLNPFSGTFNGIAVDSEGNLYIADWGNWRIRKVSSGVITTIAGNGLQGFSGDGGPATNARLVGPQGLAVGTAGNLFIADGGFRIRKVSTNGVITTVAQGDGSFVGDNGPALSAEFDVEGIAVDTAGNIYLCDPVEDRIWILVPSATAAPAVTGIANAASNLSGPISPGQIVAIKGSGLGPGQLTQFHVGSSGLVDCQLAGTTVQVNGTCAPIIYTSATQVAAIVPYSVSSGTAQVTVAYQGQTTTAVSVPIAPSAPGVFTLDSTGKGAGACVNQDGSINMASNPSKIGDVISCYATGEGQTTPSGVDGKPATVPLPQPNLTVSVSIGGQTVRPQYAGGAPGEVAGIIQINVQIPSGIQTGNAVPVVVQVGSTSSQSGVTIAVR